MSGSYCLLLLIISHGSHAVLSSLALLFSYYCCEFLFFFLVYFYFLFFFFFSSRRRHTRSLCDWSSDVCSSDLVLLEGDTGNHDAWIGVIGELGLMPPHDRLIVGNGGFRTHPTDDPDGKRR